MSKSRPTKQKLSPRERAERDLAEHRKNLAELVGYRYSDEEYTILRDRGSDVVRLRVGGATVKIPLGKHCDVHDLCSLLQRAASNARSERYHATQVARLEAALAEMGEQNNG